MPIKTNASDNNNNKANDNNNSSTTVAKTAGFLVFSGIALSILKTLNPYNTTITSTAAATSTATSQESNQPLDTYPKPISYQEPIIKKPKAKVVVETEASTTPPPPPPPTLQSTSSSGGRSIVIVKGDTLWGLSNKYGVSVDAIKEANGLTGNTIYAGKKLVIP